MVWTGVNWAGLVLMAYLIGSLPTAYLLGRWLRGVDIRTLGDGNMGAGNAYHVLGRRVGVAVAVVDAAKGTLAAFVAKQIADGALPPMAAGMATVAGHNWPFFLQFRGGRGAASALGTLLFILPRAAFPLGLLAFIPLFITRSTTVALTFVFIPLPLVAWLTGASYMQIGYAGVLPITVGVSHLFSIKRPAFAGEVGAAGAATEEWRSSGSP